MNICQIFQQRSSLPINDLPAARHHSRLIDIIISMIGRASRSMIMSPRHWTIWVSHLLFKIALRPRHLPLIDKILALKPAVSNVMWTHLPCHPLISSVPFPLSRPRPPRTVMRPTLFPPRHVCPPVAKYVSNGIRSLGRTGRVSILPNTIWDKCPWDNSWPCAVLLRCVFRNYSTPPGSSLPAKNDRGRTKRIKSFRPGNVLSPPLSVLCQNWSFADTSSEKYAKRRAVVTMFVCLSIGDSSWNEEIGLRTISPSHDPTHWASGAHHHHFSDEVPQTHGDG